MPVHPDGSRRLVSAEREYLATLVREFGPRLFAYVRRGCAAGTDAEEIVAETFCRAAANISAVRSAQRADLYLLTIARNLCRDDFRRSRPRTSTDDCLRAQPARVAEPHETAGQNERTRALRAAVAELPDAQREVVVLRLSSGLTFEEIAELLGIPLGTALSRMHAALQRLRHPLGCVHER